MTHQILSLELDWNEHGRLKGDGEGGLSDDDYIALRDNLSLIELPPLQDRPKHYFHGEMIGTIDDLTAFTRFGFKPRISRVRGIFQESLSQIGVPEPTPQQQQVVNISIPNAALFAVRTLQVIENECTNYVQSWLEKGWRIVAVCPPNDCRRPTFILGHADQNPERP